MFRNIQFKIITIFFLIGIIIIAGLGVFFLTSIHGLEQQIINSNFQNIQEEIQIFPPAKGRREDPRSSGTGWKRFLNPVFGCCP